jgi:hypothetical protein
MKRGEVPYANDEMMRWFAVGDRVTICACARCNRPFLARRRRSWCCYACSKGHFRGLARTAALLAGA